MDKNNKGRNAMKVTEFNKENKEKYQGISPCELKSKLESA